MVSVLRPGDRIHQIPAIGVQTSRRSVASASEPAPGYAAWWKADSLTLSNGDAVTSWLDSSANGHNVAQGTAEKKPTYLTNQLNGLPIVRFDGNGVLLGNDSGMPTGNMSIIGVFKKAANFTGHGQFASVLTYGAAGTGKTLFYSFGEDANFGTNAFGVSQYGDAIGIADSCAAFYVFSFVRLGSNYSLWRNNAGAVSKSMTTGTVLSGAVSSLALGEFNAPLGGGSNLTGDIAEILVYASALTDTLRNATEQYLATKYGLTL